MKPTIKKRDTGARAGGEHFAIMLVEAGPRSGLSEARRIRGLPSANRLDKKGPGKALGRIAVPVGVAQHRPG